MAFLSTMHCLCFLALRVGLRALASVLGFQKSPMAGMVAGELGVSVGKWGVGAQPTCNSRQVAPLVRTHMQHTRLDVSRPVLTQPLGPCLTSIVSCQQQWLVLGVIEVQCGPMSSGACVSMYGCIAVMH